MEVIDIDTLTLEEYLAMTREEQGPGLVRPIIGADVQFEIKPQFMRELRENRSLDSKRKMLMSTLKMCSTSLVYSIFREFLMTQSCFECSL